MAPYDSTYLDADSPSAAVIQAVANASDEDPREMEPLYDAIDPDALDALVRSAEDHGGTELTLEFSYNDCWVRLGDDGELTVFRTT